MQDVYAKPSAIRRIMPDRAVAARRCAAASRARPPASAGVPYANLFQRRRRQVRRLARAARGGRQGRVGYNPAAVSPAGAQGLMQLMPAHRAGLGVDPLDPAQAVDGAARLLAGLLKDFGSQPLALAAYNAGRGAVRRYGGIPPYAETQAYVAEGAARCHAEVSSMTSSALAPAATTLAGPRPAAADRGGPSVQPPSPTRWPRRTGHADPDLRPPPWRGPPRRTDRRDCADRRKDDGKDFAPRSPDLTARRGPGGPPSRRTATTAATVLPRPPPRSCAARTGLALPEGSADRAPVTDGAGDSRRWRGAAAAVPRADRSVDGSGRPRHSRRGRRRGGARGDPARRCRPAAVATRAAEATRPGNTSLAAGAAARCRTRTRRADEAAADHSDSVRRPRRRWRLPCRRRPLLTGLTAALRHGPAAPTAVAAGTAPAEPATPAPGPAPAAPAGPVAAASPSADDPTKPADAAAAAVPSHAPGTRMTHRRRTSPRPAGRTPT